MAALVEPSVLAIFFVNEGGVDLLLSKVSRSNNMTELEHSC